MWLLIVLFFMMPVVKKTNDNSQDSKIICPHSEGIETILTLDEDSPIGISMDDFLDNVVRH